jgi:hypothetical protein
MPSCARRTRSLQFRTRHQVHTTKAGPVGGKNPVGWQGPSRCATALWCLEVGGILLRTTLKSFVVAFGGYRHATGEVSPDPNRVSLARYTLPMPPAPGHCAVHTSDTSTGTGFRSDQVRARTRAIRAGSYILHVTPQPMQRPSVGGLRFGGNLD